MSTAPTAKRFYENADLIRNGDEATLALDGRPAKTRGGGALSGPAPLLAAIADEWNAQGEELKLDDMPLTALLSTAIDNAEMAEQWRSDIIAFAETDTLCYRADRNDELAARQSEVWEPFCQWFENRYGAPLTRTTSVIAVEQSPALRDAVLCELRDKNALLLFGLYRASATCVSTILAFALWRKVAAADAIFDASRLDETFQTEKWGVDAEAEAREQKMREDFRAVARYISLLSPA